jgi:hypothetical protein
MKKYTRVLMLLLLNISAVIANNEVTIVAPSSSAAEGLDLMAVSEIFKETDNLEAFEKTINDPEVGINNLDLDNNGDVDYIRVVEEIVADTHVIILQAAIGVDEFQDVATIEVEKSGEQYNMQIHGNEIIYGAHYYVAPVQVHVHTWPIISWIYRPVYRPYRSAYHFGFYPRWWKPYKPVHFNVYRTRTVRFTSRNTFAITKTRSIKPVTRVVYKPRTSTKVTRSLHVNKTTSATGKITKKVGVKKTTTHANGKTVTSKKGIAKTHNPKTGKTTVTKKKKKTKVNKNGKKTKVKKTTKKKK